MITVILAYLVALIAVRALSSSPIRHSRVASLVEQRRPGRHLAYITASREPAAQMASGPGGSGQRVRVRV